MTEKKRVPFTREGYDRVSAELKEMIEVKRPEIIAAVADARSHGDLRENAAYDVARQDQAMIEMRIAQLEEQLRNAEIIDDTQSEPNGVVSLGRTVVVDYDGEEETYKIVSPAEARPIEGKISDQSPIGKQIKGHMVGETIDVTTPGGMVKITIKSVE